MNFEELRRILDDIWRVKIDNDPMAFGAEFHHRFFEGSKEERKRRKENIYDIYARAYGFDGGKRAGKTAHDYTKHDYTKQYVENEHLRWGFAKEEHMKGFIHILNKNFPFGGVLIDNQDWMFTTSESKKKFFQRIPKFKPTNAVELRPKRFMESIPIPQKIFNLTDLMPTTTPINYKTVEIWVAS